MDASSDMDSEAEARLAQVVEALDRADVPAPFSLDPGLPILVRELDEWLQDDRQRALAVAGVPEPRTLRRSALPRAMSIFTRLLSRPPALGARTPTCPK